jgi:UDP-N-acetylmuramyl tripeptide synthase
MESLTLEPSEAAGAEAEDRALAVVREVWRSGAATRGHELLAATRLVLGSERLGRHPSPRPLPEAELERARAAGVAARARGGGGTVLPGKVLLARNPRALAELGARLPLGVVLVSGTNGKTTTAAMIASLLSASGLAVVHNRAGANTHWGIATALVEQNGEVGVFEVDEAWLGPVAAELEPRAMVLGNLFRDRTDGYGELDAIAAAWSALARAASAAGATLVLDADDATVASMDAAGGSALLYGVDDARVALAGDEHSADATVCRACNTRMVLEPRFLSHLGHWSCPGCGAARPAPAVSARLIELDGLSGSRVRVDTPLGRLDLQLALPGVYNVYNALAAVATGIALEVAGRAIVSGLAGVRPGFGRAERIRVGADSDLVILLMKNPAGANALVRLLEQQPAGRPLHLWMALNDAEADGRDVSWIWDADFEPLAARVGRVTCAGTRAHELALRLKYGGWPAESILVEPAVDASLDAALARSRGQLVALPNYTALLELRTLLTRRGLARSYWA